MKSLITLIALATLSANVFAGDPKKNNARTQTQQLGGESGGGVPRGALTTNKQIHEFLKSLKEGEEDYIARFLDPRIFLVNKKRTVEEEGEFQEVSIAWKVINSGKYAGRILIREREALNPDVDFMTIEMSLIQDEDLRSAIKKMYVDKMYVDYEYVQEHEEKFKRAYERVNPNGKFDISNYKNLVFEVVTSQVNAELTEFKPQEGPCGNGKDKTMSVMGVFKFATPICISLSELRKIKKLAFEAEVQALTAHEQTHQFGYKDEVVPNKVQDYFLNELSTKRFYVRIQTTNLLSEVLDESQMPRTLSEEGYLRAWQDSINGAFGNWDNAIRSLLIYASLTRNEKRSLTAHLNNIRDLVLDIQATNSFAQAKSNAEKVNEIARRMLTEVAPEPVEVTK